MISFFAAGFRRLSIFCAVCVLFLSSCGNPFYVNSPPANFTPLALTPGAGSPTVPALKISDWTTYHRDNARSGSIADIADPQQLGPAWKTKLDGAVYAEPLVVGERVLVATEGDSLYSLDARTGNVQWHTTVGTPMARSELPCGNIDPLGITGTPVYDPATGLLFAVAEVGGPAHILVGLDITNGQVRVRRIVDTSDMDTRAHQQRAALALSQGMIYVAYGGLAGDCGNYHGRVVASRTDGQGPLLSYQVPTTREGGIWTPTGAAVDGDGHIYVSVGNGETTQGAWDHSDSVLRLSSRLQLEDGFAPTQWQHENAIDADLGSTGPLLLPDGLIFVAGKTGLGYLLHAQQLGGIGGQIQELRVCDTAVMGSSAFANGQVFASCTKGIQQILIELGATMKTGWQAPAGVNGAPIVVGHTVYSISGDGTLFALNSETGNIRTQLKLDTTSSTALPHFVTPTFSAGRIFIGTTTGIIAVSVS